MMDTAQAAVEAALKAGADYADARINRLSQENLVSKNGVLEGAEAPEEFGIGVRVLKDGAWGFAAAPCTPGGVHELAPGLARRACKMARDVAPVRTENV
ncbi:MAG: DNA gyrase modulator, partial [Planctomycetota bacterium]